MQLDGQTGTTDFLQQRVEAVEAGLRGEFDVVTVATHGGQETAHLGKRCAARPLDAPERLAVLGQRIGKLVPHGADLEHHHADGVRDDVVELARDPRALLCHRDACGRLALALGLDRTFLRRFGLRGTLAQSKAGAQAIHEVDGDEDELADGQVAGDVVDDGHDAAEYDANPVHACLQRIAQVSEQERGRQPDGKRG